MRTYLFRYRRVGQFFWRKYRVVGHAFSRDHSGHVIDTEKMVIYFPDGGLMEIGAWSKCEVKLGPDFFLVQTKGMEANAGQAIPTNVTSKV